MMDRVKESLNGISEHAFPIIIAVLVQTGAAIWWASAVSTKVEALDRGLERRAAIVINQDERVTRLEEKMNSVVSGVADIKELLNRRATGGR